MRLKAQKKVTTDLTTGKIKGLDHHRQAPYFFDFMARPAGFEPATHGFVVGCSELISVRKSIGKTIICLILRGLIKVQKGPFHAGLYPAVK